VQVNNEKEDTSTVGMSMSEKPTMVNITAHMLNTIIRKVEMWAIMHRKKDAGENLQCKKDSSR
jgi:hypothetical protein